MPTNYPAQVTALSQSRTNSTLRENVHPTDHNDANQAINQITATLGVNPQGSFATVQARLAAIAATTKLRYYDVNGWDANSETDRAIDIDNTTLYELTNVVATLIFDLKDAGLMKTTP